jgi:hypothetical protein
MKSVFNLDDVIDILWGIGFLGVVRNGVNEYSYGASAKIQEGERMVVIQPGFREALRSTSSIAMRLYEPGRIRSRYASGLRGTGSDYKLRAHSARRVLETVQYMMQNLEERVNRAGLPEEAEWKLRQTLHQMWSDVVTSLDELGDESVFYGVAQDMASTFKRIESGLQAGTGLDPCAGTKKALANAFCDAAETLRSPSVLRNFVTGQ